MEQKCTLRACKYGPGAVGVGWELGLMGLAMHLTAADRAFLILLGGVAFFLAQVWALVFSGFARAAMRSRRSLWGAFPPG